MADDKPNTVPKQSQSLPGSEKEMNPRPQYEATWYKGSGKLKDKVALISGADSGIGRAVAIMMAREGAHIACIYLQEHEDAAETKQAVEKEGTKCLLLPCDIREKKNCEEAVKKTLEAFGKINILVNNSAVQYENEDFCNQTEQQIDTTFRTNIYGMMFLTQVALPHMGKDDSIINTTSVNAYKGHKTLIDYTSTKGAIVAFTYAMSQQLVSKGIRVNGVAPGPIWTPLIPATFDADHVAEFGKNVPMERPGQPEEVAPAYVFLAARDSSYITGQVIHVNGGVVTHS